MAKEDKLKSTYYNALKRAGYKVTGKESPAQMRNMWKEFRSSYSKTKGVSAPTVYQYAKEYKDSPTIPFGKEWLDDFMRRVWRIYHDTIAWMDDNKEGTHDSGKLASIASYREDYHSDLLNSVMRIQEAIQVYITSGIPAEVIAEELDKSVELDYTIAVALQPPSDVIYLFDETVEQIEGIWNNINERIRELAIQAEAEYRGE